MRIRLGSLLDNILSLFRASPAMSYRVEISEDGRSGQVRYSEGTTASVFYWEFGGGDTIASISVPTEQKWAKETPWPLERRDEILQRVAAETIRQKCAGCVAEFDRGWINLNKGG
jgi:ssDNA-binding replication factor A large subunit